MLALKGTPGRIPSSERGLSLAAMTSFGPLARSVEDLRLGYAALARPDPRDPWRVEVPAERDRGGVRRVLVLDPADAEAEVRGAIRLAASSLADAGYELADGVPPRIDDIPDLWARLFLTEVQAQWDDLSPLLSDHCQRWLEEAFAARPPLIIGAELIEAYRERHALAADADPGAGDDDRRAARRLRPAGPGLAADAVPFGPLLLGGQRPRPAGRRRARGPDHRPALR